MKKIYREKIKKPIEWCFWFNYKKSYFFIVLLILLNKFFGYKTIFFNRKIMSLRILTHTKK